MDFLDDFDIQKINLSEIKIPCLTNTTSEGNISLPDCTNISWDNSRGRQHSYFYTLSEQMFFYTTPLILVIGLAGNCLSFAVFLTKTLRKLSASSYLAALSLSDTCTLMFYVLAEWLRRGLKHQIPNASIEFLDNDGMCQLLTYLSYISRIMSSWIIVIFTIERFTAICNPLKRSRRSAKRNICIMCVIAMISVLYKPVLTRETTKWGLVLCTSMEEFVNVSFVLDTVYSISITLIPFTIITALNILIIRKLFLRNKEHSEMFAEEAHTKIKLEFTVILIAISFCFVLFNLPFTVIWIRFRFLEKHDETQMAWLAFSRTFFYMNYCINFFLYSITGKCFRRALVRILLCRLSRHERTDSYIQCRRLGSTMTKQASMRSTTYDR